MAKESLSQPRARKSRSAKGDYYPKVNLAERTGDPEKDFRLPSSFDLPAATPLAATETVGGAGEASPPDRFDQPIATPLAAMANEPAEPLRLPECLDLLAAKPLVRALRELRGNPIVLDASSVRQLGAQCVQALLSAKRTWSADGVALSVVNFAPRIIEDLRLLGIDSTAFTSGAQRQ